MYGLLVEDQEVIIDKLKKTLKPHGYILDSCTQGNSALLRLNQYQYDFIILDLKLPDCFGLDLVEEIFQRSPHINIVVISSLIHPQTAIQSFDMGVDDFIRKPFNTEEVRARLDRIRKCKTKNTFQLIYEFSGLRFFYTESKVCFKNRSIKLTQKERNLLKKLIDNNSCPVAYAPLMESIWGDYRIEVDIRLLHSHMSKLRRKLKTLNPNQQYIITCHQMGYKLAN